VYEDRTQNFDPEIHEKYLIYDTLFPLPHADICSHVQSAECRL